MSCKAAARAIASSEEDVKAALAKRGEEFPLFIDVNMYEWTTMKPDGPDVEILVLRLDGKVEKVKANPGNPKDLIFNK